MFNNKKGEDSSDVFEIIVEDQEEEKKQWNWGHMWSTWLNIQKGALIINKKTMETN